VTESVVLPPLFGRLHHAPVNGAEAGPVYPAIVPGVVDWHDHHQFAALVNFSLVYLAGLR
jgi:hypothetical protein